MSILQRAYLNVCIFIKTCQHFMTSFDITFCIQTLLLGFLRANGEVRGGGGIIMWSLRRNYWMDGRMDGLQLKCLEIYMNWVKMVKCSFKQKNSFPRIWLTSPSPICFLQKPRNIAMLSYGVFWTSVLSSVNQCLLSCLQLLLYCGVRVSKWKVLSAQLTGRITECRLVIWKVKGTKKYLNWSLRQYFHTSFFMFACVNFQPKNWEYFWEMETECPNAQW